MRSTALGCAGVEDVISPNLDEFAVSGSRFTRAIANSPACSPSRANTITGLHTLTHQLVNNDVQLRTDIKSLAHCLNDLGYRSGFIGKWHMDCADRGAFIPPGPRRQGFDDFWAGYNCNHEYFDAYYYLNDNPEPVWIDGYEPDKQTDLAIDYISKKTKEDDPFFLFLSYGPPHCPYRQVPQKYLDMYPVENIKLKPNAVDTTDVDKQVIAGYYAHITALDDSFGRLLNSIEEIGIRNDTIIIFTSDHGDMLYSQHRGWKSKPWSESVGIPMIVSWPQKIPGQRVSDGIVSLVDLMPTLLGLVNADVPSELEGNDLSDLFLGDETASPESVFINFYVIPDFFSYTEWRGVITKQYTYAAFRNEPWLLYDDKNDPHQLHNLVESRKHANILTDMQAELAEWLTVLDDPFESSAEVAAKYYPGSVGGVVQSYENAKIKAGKQKRKVEREDESYRRK